MIRTMSCIPTKAPSVSRAIDAKPDKRGSLQKADGRMRKHNQGLEGRIVRVIDGPFTGFRGEVKEVDEQTVKVDVQTFGRVTPWTWRLGRSNWCQEIQTDPLPRHDETALRPSTPSRSIGDDLRDLPLSMGKANLQRLLARRPDGIFLSNFKQGEIGPDLFRAACRMGGSGVQAS